MAKRHQLKVADPVDVEADDPFAELTRMIGFGPRRSDPAAAARNAGPQPVETVEDDFGVDLEQELLGELATEYGEPETDPESGGSVAARADLDARLDAAVGSESGEPRGQGSWVDWSSPAPHHDAVTELDAGVAPDEPGEPPAAAIFSGEQVAPSAADFDEDELAREFAIALHASVEDVFVEPRQSAAQPLASPSPDFDLAGELEEEFRAIDLAAEEFSVDLPRAAAEGVAYEAADFPGAEPTSGWDDPADEELERDFAKIHLASDEAFEELPEAVDAGRQAPRGDDPDVVYQIKQWLEAEYSTDMEAAGNGWAARAAGPTAGRDLAAGHEDDAAVPAGWNDADAGPSGSDAGDDEPSGYVAAGGSPDVVERPRTAASSVAGVSPVAAEPPAGAFSLEDELNALLGNIRAAGRNSAATTQGLGSGNAAAARPAGDHPRAPDRTGHPASPRAHSREPGWARASHAAREQLPDFDDEAFGAALVEGLDRAGEPAGMTPSGHLAADRPVAVAAAGGEEIDFGSAIPGGAPEIETVEVADRPVALADDLDIPELDFMEDLPPATAHDDLDAEFASLLNEMNVGEPVRPRADAQRADAPAADANGIEVEGDDLAALSEVPPPVMGDGEDAVRFELDDDGFAADAPLQYDPDPDEAFAEAPEIAPPAAAAPRRQRRGLLFAGLVGAVAVAGGVGALALSLGGSGGDGPALVEADLSPVKVKPDNPGGTTVPNQNNAVYESVAGVSPAAEPRQERLVTTAEEPIDVSPPMREEDAEVLPDLTTPGEDLATGEIAAEAQPKGEDRIEQILQEAEAADPNAAVTAVEPRKVRTLVVKPDGTLVPREEPAIVDGLATAAAEATMAAAEPAADQGNPTAPLPDATGLLPPAEAAADSAPVAEQRPAGSPVMPDIAPIAPPRPSRQPIAVVDQVEPDQVAAVAPAASPATDGGAAWSVQIASQPNEAAARSTYQDLAGRYGSVLAGHQVDIVKAEIAGRGTFWRVRVLADSRNAAIRLCESYKDAGGNCFVSR